MAKLKKFQLKLITDTTDQAFFLFAFLLGFLSITILKSGFESPGTAAFFASLVLIAYGSIAYNLSIFKLSAEKIGDNCYYLGFLFTLISLSNSLYLFSSNHNSDQIISDFGVALASTIIGILLRIVFSQMKIEPDQIEDTVKETLTDISLRLSGDLENVISEVAGVSLSINQLMTDSLKKFEEQLKKSLDKHEKLAESIGEVTDAVIEKNKQTAESIAQSVDELQLNEFDALKEPLAKLQSSLNDLSQKLTDSNSSVPDKAIQNFAQSLENANVKIDQLTNVIDTAIQNTKTSKTDLILRLLTSRFKK